MERFKLSYTRSTRQKIIITLAAIIVFVTTYALILPAITIDTDTAEKEPGIDVGAVDTVELPAASLEESVEGITVSVEADVGVFPANTSLSLQKAESDTNHLQTLIEAAVQSKVESYEAVDIAFEDENGDPVSPQDSFSVKMTSDSIKGEADRVLVQVSGDAATIVESSEFAYKQVEFSAKEDATYAIVEKSELTSEYLSADGGVYEVTVTYDYTAQIPDGAKLEVTEYSEDSNVYIAAKKVFNDALSAEEAQLAERAKENINETTAEGEAPAVLFTDIIDITIRGKDSSVIEPAAPVHVSIKRKNLPENFNADEGGLIVQHLNEKGDTPVVEKMDSAVVLGSGSLTASFTTDSFSSYSLQWRERSGWYTYNRISTIHYGYMNGNTFVEFDSGTPAHTPEFNGVSNYSADYSYLIHDIPGYKYARTKYSTSLNNNASGTTISPLLSYSGGWRYTTDLTTNSNPTWTNVANNSHIYVVYEPDNSEPTPGGTAKLYETDVVNPDDPTMHKTSVNNHDGTRNISLSVDGHANPVMVEKLADVIVIFDVSGSMNEDMNGNTTSNAAESRLSIGKEAIKDLANDLLSAEYKNKDGNPLIRMSLVTFSNVAQENPFTILDSSLRDENGRPMNQSDAQILVNGEQFQPYPDLNFTSSPAKFGALVDTVNAGGGTNWEQALKIANEMPVDPERETIVIFVSDGDPTFRVTRDPTELVTDTAMEPDCDERWFRQYNVYGQGNGDYYGYCYDAALAEAQSIVQQGKHLYGIGISTDVSKMDRLTTEAGAGAKHSYVVANKNELEDAFEDIKVSISGFLGWSDVSVSDGITGMTNLVAKSRLVGMSVGKSDADITYTKIIKDENGNVIQTIENWDPTAEKPNPCGTAYYNAETGALEWNMGEDFQLADNTTYVVNFTVWPNQEAIDIVTKLNNGEITFDQLSPDEQAQIAVETSADGQYSVYTLKTNTHAGMSYTPTRTANGGNTTPLGPEVSVRCEDEVEPLVMQSIPIRINKQWVDSLTGGEDQQEEVTLKLWRRPVGGTEDDWEEYPVYYKTPDGETVYSNTLQLSAGNKWSTGEFYVSPGLKDKSGVIREQGYEFSVTEPGIDYHYELDGEVINPILQGYGTYDPDLDVDPALYNVRDVYIVRDYQGDLDEDSFLTAGNIVKGGIYLGKDVVDANDPETSLPDDQEFVIHGYILDPKNNPYTFNMDWDDRTDVSGVNDAGADWIAHQNDPIAFHIYDRDGTRIAYKMHVPSTGDIEICLKSGQHVRFVNVPKDCTYSFWEDDADMPQNYKLYSANGYNQTRNAAGDYVPYTDGLPPVVDGATVSGTVYGNVQHNVDFKNTMVRPGSIVIKKIVTKSDELTQIFPDESFTFTGRIRNGSAGLTNLPYTIRDKDGTVIRTGTFANTYNNNSITFELKAGEYIEIPNVPNNAAYRFFESALASNSDYEFVSASGSATSATGANVQNPPTVNATAANRIDGTMHVNEEHNIQYKNKIKNDPVELQIKKVDANSESVRINGATFNLYSDANHNNVATDYLGNEIASITTGGQNVADGIGYIGNLWAGTYYLVETGPPGGYLPLSDHVIINVGSDGTVTVTNPDNAAATGVGSVTVNNGLVTVAIPNVPVNTEPLPSTGGRGTALFYISGGALILAAAWIYIFRFRQRKGGKRRPEFP